MFGEYTCERARACVRAVYASGPGGEATGAEKRRVRARIWWLERACAYDPADDRYADTAGIVTSRRHFAAERRVFVRDSRAGAYLSPLAPTGPLPPPRTCVSARGACCVCAHARSACMCIVYWSAVLLLRQQCSRLYKVSERRNLADQKFSRRTVRYRRTEA